MTTTDAGADTRKTDARYLAEVHGVLRQAAQQAARLAGHHHHLRHVRVHRPHDVAAPLLAARAGVERGWDLPPDGVDAVSVLIQCIHHPPGGQADGRTGP
jgi:hypothetical protein